MALAVSRTGTIVKKCDRSNHRPETNKKCAVGTCQHTCDNPERCPHAWTLRYWVNDRQLEKSFRDATNPATGRVNFGSGKKLAEDFQLKLTVDKRSGDITFADHGRALGGSNRMLNSREVGDLLGLPERTIRAQWKEWGIKTYRVGRALRWRERDVYNWLEHQEAA